MSTLSAPSHALAATPRRQLTKTTAVVVAIHALLILGLPRWATTASRAGQDTGAFTTRMVAPPSPTPTPVVAPTPPQPKPAQPAPPPRPKPRPVAQADRPAPPEPKDSRTSEAPVESSPAAAAPPATTNQTARRSDGSDPNGSLLAPKADGFGGTAAPTPIALPLPEGAMEPALKAAKRMDDVSVRIPQAARVEYRTAAVVKGERIEFPTALAWRQDGVAYESRWTLFSELTGSQTRTNTGLITPLGLLPVQAAFQPPGGSTTRFDYAAGKVRFEGGAEADVAPGMQDRLGVLIQLGALLGGDAQRYPAGTVIELPAAHNNGAGRWRFAVVGVETLYALGHDLATVHLVHEPQDANDARVEIWLGRQFEYLPVRVRINEANGDAFDHVMITAYTEPVPKAPAR